MNHSDALRLRKLSKDLCHIHTFVPETYLGVFTGDLACTSCGHEQSKYEHASLLLENELGYILSRLEKALLMVK